MSGGEDGFVVGWDAAARKAAFRFQAGTHRISAVSPRPGRPEAALSETDGLGFHRVSAWDLASRQRYFALRFKDPVNFLGYSASGGILVVGRNSLSGVVLLDPRSGEVLASLEASGPVTLAATGRSERTLVTYSPLGEISYWEVASGRRISSAKAPSHLSRPALFANNRYLAGLDAEGRVVAVDALDGRVLARSASRGHAALIVRGDSGDGLAATGGGASSLLSFSAQAGFVEAPASIPEGKVLALGEGFVVGLADGKVAALAQDGSAVPFSAGYPSLVVDAHATDGRAAGTMAAIAGDRVVVFPSDPAALVDGYPVYAFPAEGADRVACAADACLLWSSDGSRAPRLFRQGADDVEYALPVGTPVLSASLRGERALFLDARGRLSVFETKTGKPVFSYESAGLLDAALVGERSVLAGRVRLSPDEPALLALDVLNGEVVKVDFPADAASRIVPAGAGGAYVVATEYRTEGARTSLVLLGKDGGTKEIAEYASEDLSAAVAESSGRVATILGGETAAVFASGGRLVAPRGDALPKRIFWSGDLFAVVDWDGRLVWRDAEDGRSVAVLSVREDRWSLEVPGRPETSGSIVAGR